jgi:preprotein translocase subunit YajC
MIAVTNLLFAAAKTTTKHSSTSFTFLFLIIILYGGLYYFYFRPRRKKQVSQRQQQKKVEVGDRAQTIGGFIGTVTQMNDDIITLRTDSGAELDFIPSAIARKYVPPSYDDAEDEPETHDEAQEGDK